MGLRDRVAIIRALLLHAISSPHQPYAGYGYLSRVVGGGLRDIFLFLFPTKLSNKKTTKITENAQLHNNAIPFYAVASTAYMVAFL